MPSGPGNGPYSPPPVLPVSLLVSSARLLLERQLGLAWVAGEISDCRRATSGHPWHRARRRCPSQELDVAEPARRDRSRGEPRGRDRGPPRARDPECRRACRTARRGARASIRSSSAACRSCSRARGPRAPTPPRAASRTGRPCACAARPPWRGPTTTDRSRPRPRRSNAGSRQRRGTTRDAGTTWR